MLCYNLFIFIFVCNLYGPIYVIAHIAESAVKNWLDYIVNLRCFLNILIRWLQEAFDTADSDHSGLLDEFEVIKVIKKLNTGLTTIKVQQKLKVCQYIQVCRRAGLA